MDAQKKMVSLGAHPFATGWHVLMLNRHPLFNVNGENSGLIIYFTDMTGFPLFNSFLALHQSDQKKFGEERQQAHYVLTDAHANLPLTARQREVLFYSIRGNSCKEIGKRLGISYRTVEEHINQVKIRLNCNTKSQVVEQVLDKGFLCYIPERIWLQTAGSRAREN